MTIDEKAFAEVCKKYHGNYLTDRREGIVPLHQIIEAYEAAKSAGQPVMGEETDDFNRGCQFGLAWAKGHGATHQPDELAQFWEWWRRQDNMEFREAERAILGWFERYVNEKMGETTKERYPSEIDFFFANLPKRESGARENQGGFVIGDVVEYIGKYKDDAGWKGETFVVCEVRQRQWCIEYTIREHSRWEGLTDGLLPSDLRLATTTSIEGQS